jgi:DnaA-homolog protein
MEQLALRVRLRDWARFSTYVAGPNREAVDVLADQGPAAARVIWLWGRPGTGKTHLLQAACAAAGAAGVAAAYLDLHQTPEPERLDGCDALALVCLDSLELVAGDAAWNAAVFRLHTLMQDTRARLVVASRPAPASLEFRLPDLRSRLLAADTWQLHELDDAEQVQALQVRAAQRGLDLGEDAALFLVRRLPRDMHSLCRVLDRLDEASLVAQRRLTVPFLRQALAAQAQEAPPADA